MKFPFKTKKKKASPIGQLQQTIKKQKKKIRRRFLLKQVKALLTLILPTVLAFLASSAVKSFLRLKLRETASGIPNDVPDQDDGQKEAPVPVTSETSRPEFITPEPVETSPARKPAGEPSEREA